MFWIATLSGYSQAIVIKAFTHTEGGKGGGGVERATEPSALSSILHFLSYRRPCIVSLARREHPEKKVKCVHSLDRKVKQDEGERKKKWKKPLRKGKQQYEVNFYTHQNLKLMVFP